MLDIGFGELILVAVIALIALGPKQLPEVARVAGKFINDMRRVASEFTGGVAGGLIDVDAILKPKDPEIHPVEESVARGSQSAPVPEPMPLPIHVESPEEERDRKNQMSFVLPPETHPDTKGESRG